MLNEYGSLQCDVTFQRIEELVDLDSQDPQSSVSQATNMPSTGFGIDHGGKSVQEEECNGFTARREEYQDPEDDPKRYKRIRFTT